MFGFGFSRRRPRQFDYRPVHYDPVAEAREQRRREVLGDEATPSSPAGGYTPGQYIRDRGFQSGRIARREQSDKSRRIVIRLAVLIALSALFVWWLLF